MISRTLLLIFLFSATLPFTHADGTCCIVEKFQQFFAADQYDTFQLKMDNWANGASGAEKIRRIQVADGLSQIMQDHNFVKGGTSFSQFQRYLASPYKPNLRDIYFVLNKQIPVPVTPSDVAVICAAAGISPVPADSLDLILCGLRSEISINALSQLDNELLQFEINWLTGTNSKKISIDDYLQHIEADPEQDCDSIFNNLDAPGIAALTQIVATAVPSWSLPTPDYDSFDANLTAWINFKFTDAASKVVAQQEVGQKILKLIRDEYIGREPFSQFQADLAKSNPQWGGPLLYFSLSKFSTGDEDNLPVPTDALEAIFRCAGLDVTGCQPNDVDRLYTGLLSHQNGGTAGSLLTDDDVAGYANIVNFILTAPGGTFNDIENYIHSIQGSFSTYAQQDLLALMDPLHNPRPYYYGEDTEYFRNDQKLLPLHPEDAHYYREHVIPSLGVGKYQSADNVGRYRYVSGKGGEMYLTVHYNQFLRVDQLMALVTASGSLTIAEMEAWINSSADPSSPSYAPFFYKEIEDLAQIAGIRTIDLLNLSTLNPAKAKQILQQTATVFLVIQANPPPPIN